MQSQQDTRSNVRDLHSFQVQIEQRLQQLHDIRDREPTPEIENTIKALWATVAETNNEMSTLFNRAA